MTESSTQHGQTPPSAGAPVTDGKAFASLQKLAISVASLARLQAVLDRFQVKRLSELAPENYAEASAILQGN